MQTSIENNNSVILNNNQQEIDASIPLNYYLNINTTSSPFLKQYSKDAQFAKVEDNKVIYRLVNYFKIPSISQIPAKIQFCIKAGFHDSHNNKGFSARHIIARNHLDKIHSYYQLPSQCLSLVKYAKLIMKDMDYLIKCGGVALAYAGNEKALVFVADIRNNRINTLQYTLATFYIDSISETSIRFVMGTLYEVPKNTYELVKNGSDRYLPLLPHEKLIQIATSEVDSISVCTYQQLEERLVVPKSAEPAVFDEGVTYHQLIYKDAVEVSFQEVNIKLEEISAEIEAMIDEDFKKLESIDKLIEDHKKDHDDFCMAAKKYYEKIKSIVNVSNQNILEEFINYYQQMEKDIARLDNRYNIILAERSDLFWALQKSMGKIAVCSEFENILFRNNSKKKSRNYNFIGKALKIQMLKESLFQDERSMDGKTIILKLRIQLKSILVAFVRLTNLFLKNAIENGACIKNKLDLTNYIFINLLQAEGEKFKNACEENNNICQYIFFIKKFEEFEKKYPEFRYVLEKTSNPDLQTESNKTFQA